MNSIPRVEIVQRMIVDIIIAKRASDPKKFAQDVVWDFSHSAGTEQLGRMLAEQRGLNEELARIACALHDIYVCKTNKREDHAHRGALIAERLLKKTQRFKRLEIACIVEAVYRHSDKLVVSKDPYVELVKDADILAWALYEDAHDAIVAKYTDPRPIFARMNRIRRELHLSPSVRV